MQEMDDDCEDDSEDVGEDQWGIIVINIIKRMNVFVVMLSSSCDTTWVHLSSELLRMDCSMRLVLHQVACNHMINRWTM